MATGTPAKVTMTTAAPRSGFRSPQFWLGLVSVLLTFALGYNGIVLPSNLGDLINKAYNSGVVPGVIAAAIVAGIIAISLYVETRMVRKNGPTAGKPGKPYPVGGKPFYRTSEFWLGFITVGLNYLDTIPQLDQYVHIRPSASTTTLVIALIYGFARAQLKQAYANSQDEDDGNAANQLAHS